MTLNDKGYESRIDTNFSGKFVVYEIQNFLVIAFYEIQISHSEVYSHPNWVITRYNRTNQKFKTWLCQSVM